MVFEPDRGNASSFHFETRVVTDKERDVIEPDEWPHYNMLNDNPQSLVMMVLRH
jgi:hypothetical protein